jgi:hypothetical protein
MFLPVKTNNKFLKEKSPLQLNKRFSQVQMKITIVSLVSILQEAKCFLGLNFMANVGDFYSDEFDVKKFGEEYNKIPSNH